MIFVDYYKVLEIEKHSSFQEIKSAFRRQAIKWHPDKNPDIDVNEKMQLINEAYLILKDEEARKHYDVEYDKFYQYFQHKKEKQKSTSSFNEHIYEEYKFDDETLKRWMQNAKKQAVDLAKQTIKEMAELSVTATREASSKMLETFVYYAIAGIFIMLLFKTCN